MTKTFEELEIIIKQHFPNSIVENVSTGKYSLVLKATLPNNNSYIFKSNHNLFSIKGEVEFLKKSTVSPKIVKYSLPENWVCMEFIEGTNYLKTEIDAIPSTFFIELGRSLKKLHSETSLSFKSYSHKHKGETFKSFSQMLLRFFESYYKNASFLEYIKVDSFKFHKIKALIKKFDNSIAVLTHGDLHVGNLIYTNNKKVIIIDPSTERFFDRLWDYAVIKWHLRNHPKKEHLCNLILEGYDENLESKKYHMDLVICQLFFALALDYNNFINGNEDVWNDKLIDTYINILLYQE